MSFELVLFCSENLFPSTTNCTHFPCRINRSLKDAVCLDVGCSLFLFVVSVSASYDVFIYVFVQFNLFPC